MTAPLYNTEILRLAASTAGFDRLADAMASVEKRSPVCGSRVTVDLDLDDAGRVRAVGLLVRACALGQASAALMAASAPGRDARELAGVRDALAAWLAGDSDSPPDWPGVAIFGPARDYRARHPSIRLAFEAAAEAAEQAASRRGKAA